MIAPVWLEVTDEDGKVESVCTLLTFIEENMDTLTEAQHVELDGLAPGDTIDFGGGAGALCTVRRMDDDRAGMLDHVMAHAGMVSIEAADPTTAEEDGAMPWSVWTTGDGRDVIGAGETLGQAIRDALSTVSDWPVRS